MRLHQVKIDFAAEQDRMLMLIAASEQVEVRMWLTRRFVKLLWPLLVKLAEEASPRIRTQANPEARKALLGIEHQRSTSALLRRIGVGAPARKKVRRTARQRR